MKIIYSAIFVFICLSCENKSDLKQEDSSFELINISEDTNVNKKDFFNLFRLTNVIELEFRGDYYLNNIRRLIISENSIYALDPDFNNLVRYDLNGKIVSKIGVIGEGPQEIPEIVDFSVMDSGNLALISFSAMKVSIYDSLGGFVRSVKINDQIDQISTLNDQLFLSLTYFNSLNKNFGIYNLNGDTLKTSFPFPSKIFPMGLLNISGHLTKNSTNEILFNEPASSIIYGVDNNLNIYKKYQFLGDNEFWPESERHDLNGYFLSLSKGGLSFLSNYFEETDRYLFFNLNKKQSGEFKYPVDPRFGFYNKKLKKTYLSKSSNFGKYLKGPVYALNNKIYFFILKDKLLDISKNDKEFNKALNQYSENSNEIFQGDFDTPILLEFEII